LRTDPRAAARAQFVELNPFLHYVEIIRRPMLGQSFEVRHWIVVGALTVAGWLLAVLFRRNYRACGSSWVWVSLAVGSIDVYNASVDFPIFDAKSRSLKKTVLGLGKAGGRIGTDQRIPVIEALRDITISLAHGDRVALVGHNGAGKTTLLRLLSGIYEPTRGSARIVGKIAPIF